METRLSRTKKFFDEDGGVSHPFFTLASTGGTRQKKSWASSLHEIP